MTDYLKRAAWIAIVLILAVMPLFYVHDYADILSSKVVIFWIGCILVGGLCVPDVFANIVDKANRDDIEWAGVNIMDIAVLSFGVIAMISAVLSEYRSDAFTGRDSWYVGSNMIFALVVIYFLVSRFKGEKHYYIGIILVIATVVMFLGILNVLWIDPLNMTKNVDDNWRNNFLSTIGNANQFGGYLSIAIPFISMYFVLADKAFKKSVAAIALFPCYLNLFFTHADGIYAGVGVGMIFVFFISLRSSATYLSFLVNGIMMALAGFSVSLLLQAFPNTMMESIAPFMLEHKVHYIVGAGCFVLILAHMGLELHVRKETMEKILKIMSWVFAVFVIVAAVITVIYIRTHYDEWMLNRRGILWKIALYVFGDFELKEKIIGIGPSCINHRSVDYAFWIVEYYGKFYDIDNAHIDVLEYLVTTGIAGCVAYVMMFLSVAVNLMQSFIKKREPGRERCLLAAGIVGYAGQALLYGPHPLIWCTCMMLFALYRSADIEEKRQAEILE